MIKICITVRNRLAITKKCIESLERFTCSEKSIHIYDNLTNYRFDEHLEYYMQLYTEGIIDKFVINSEQSTYNCFSKAVCFNEFGFNHIQDPGRDKTNFLVLLDNDMLVCPAWDIYVRAIMEYISDKKQFDDIRIITQNPGGVTDRKQSFKVFDMGFEIGVHGGSGFWCLRPNFFDDIGFLDLNLVKGINKKHDQNYWDKIAKKTKGRPYSLAINKKLALHTGPLLSGSVCDILTKHNNDQQQIKFEELDKQIENISFEDFYKQIKDEPRCLNW